jgi:hypothetical protein
MRTPRDVEARRRYLLDRLENYRAGRNDCAAAQRELFEMLIRSSESELQRLGSAGETTVDQGPGKRK